MLRMIFFLPLILAATMANTQPKSIAGTWQGSLQAGIEIHIVFNFSPAGQGYSGTMDSPDQHVKGIPLTSVELIGDSLTVELKPAHAFYKAVRTDDTTFTGTWLQGGASLPLVVKNMQHATVATEVKRPQTPVPPFSYNSEDVVYANADKSISFGATFTYPKTGGPFITMVLITGSGAQDRDETILGHKPFAVLADYLTKKGYAVLRVDDRGVGKTTGTMANATSADFAKDVAASVAYLKTRAEVDKSKIGLVGHSEGGVIAPMVASADKSIDFIILWGAPMEGGAIINTEQNGLALQKAGISLAAVNAFKQLHIKELQLYKTAPDVYNLNTRVKEIFDAWRKLQPDSVLTSLLVTDSTVIGQNIYSIYDGLYNLPWMRFFIAHDFAADLAKVQCSVLAINGGLDTQVGAEANLGVITHVLNKAGNKNYTVVPLKGLNHLLQTAVTGDVAEYANIPETIAPLALDTIGDWLDGHIKNGKK